MTPADSAEVAFVQRDFTGTVLLVVAIDDRGDVVALDAGTGARLATETVYGSAPIARRVAAELAVHRAFDAIEAQRQVDDTTRHIGTRRNDGGTTK